LVSVADAESSVRKHNLIEIKATLRPNRRAMRGGCRYCGSMDDRLICKMMLVVLTLCSPMVLAQDEAEILDTETNESWSLHDMTLRDFTAYWDNDGTLANITDDTDRFYTNGVGLELSFDPNFTESIKEKLAPAGKWNDPRFGVGLGLKQRIYTSEFITQTNPRVDDHPYGGYLYFAFSLQRADDEKHDHFELDLGVVGERSQAEAVQRFIHRNFPDEDEPMGWGNQLANEIAINFKYERTWKSQPGEVQGVEFEFLPAVGFDLGNVAIKARAKMTFRAGMNLPDDFGPATFLGHKDHTVYAGTWGEGDFSMYAYSTVSVDAVAHDIFLDGNTFASSRSTDSEPLVFTASFGVVARYGCMYAGWAQNYQTETFETQPDAQTFGSMVFGVSFAY
jgi:lipid A 3-O-deacylase